MVGGQWQICGQTAGLIDVFNRERTWTLIATITSSLLS